MEDHKTSQANPTSLTSQYDNAIYVRNVHKKYDNGPPVLNNYCMTVKRGTIYGLLGSSGCGKTTILSCIVGLKQWDSGEVFVFGEKRLEAKKGGVLGKMLGYMPQEQALYTHLSIRETMQFYGRLFNIPSNDVSKRCEHLADLLELPKEFKLISELSGGQKRRVSLALALTHSPELLVLDEPTTGLDPLLKLKIWDYLYQLVKNLGTTIIVTTHYTEEAKLSDTIGVMRRGRLLVENTPKHLMEIYQTDLLEKVVLQLCLADEANAQIESDTQEDRNQNKVIFRSPWKTRAFSFPLGIQTLTDGVFCKAGIDSSPELGHYNISSDKCGKEKMEGSFYQTKKMEFCSSLSRIYGLATVFLLTLKRFPWFLALLLLMPSLQGSVTLSALGSKPSDLNFGIVNHEVTNWTTQCNHHKGNFCDLSALSCKYINQLQQSDVLLLKSFDSEEDALDQVHLGNIWGYLTIPNNYSQNMVEFVAFRQFSENGTIEGSRIPAYLDYSQFIAAFFIIKDLQLSFIDYLQQLAPLCGIDARQAEVPLIYRPAVYGSYDDNFTEFVMPGIIMCSLMITTCALTALMFISDKKQGTLSRAIVAGLGFTDIIFGHVITQAVVTICQILIWNLVLKYVFDFTTIGSFWLWILILCMAGICGVSFGILLGLICKDEIQALILGVFIFVICVLLGGAVFPIEHMTAFWRTFGQILPPALPITAVRSLITRSFGLTHFTVWPGFAGLIGWTIVFSILGVISYRIVSI